MLPNEEALWSTELQIGKSCQSNFDKRSVRFWFFLSNLITIVKCNFIQGLNFESMVEFLWSDERKYSNQKKETSADYGNNIKL